jgi:glycosyltransferase involved in cell wall biosynthesis
MLISVIMVTWNSSATVRHTLDSFFSQTYGPKELVVVDGGSKDDTMEIVKSYPAANITWISEPDKGMYDALNKGLKLASGDAIGVLNSDDTYHSPKSLESISHGLKMADTVHGHLNFVTDHNSKKVSRVWRGEPRPASGFKAGWMPGHPTFYVQRHVIEKVGAFDLTLETSSDYDWMLRALEVHGFTTHLIDEILIDMQQGGRSTSGVASYIHHNLEALRARQKWLNAGVVDYALFAKPLRKVGQFFAEKS